MVIAATVVRVGIASGFSLFQDELLYSYLAFNNLHSFCPHPPGIPALLRFGTLLIGKNEVGVRLFSILLSTLTILPVWMLARDLGGSKTALRAVICFVALPFYLVIGSIMTPDASQLFFWSVSLFLAWRALQLSETRWWIALGIVLGLGLYIKYILILFVPALLIAIVAHRPWHRHLRRPGLYVCLIIAFLVFVPYAAWRDSQTNWDALNYHLRDRQKFVMPNLKEYAIYHGAHLLYYSPVLYVLMLYAAGWALWRGFTRRDGALLFLGVFAAAPYVFFAVIAFFTSRILSREQWDAPAYISAVIALVVMLQRTIAVATPGATIKLLRWFRIGIATAVLILAVTVFEASTSQISRALHLTPMFSSTAGWKTLSRAIDDDFAHLSRRGAKNPFLLGNSFEEIFAYDFYGKSKKRFYTLDSDRQDIYGVTEVLRAGKLLQENLVNERGNDAVFAMQQELKPTSSDMRKVRRRRGKMRLMFGHVDSTTTHTAYRGGKAIKSYLLMDCTNLIKLPTQIHWP
jgi:hypothetical protein